MDEDEKKRRKELVGGAYDHILTVSNRILHSVKNFSIAILRLENPSYDEIADQLREVCKIMESVSDDFIDDHTTQKAVEYSRSIREIAKAITDGDENKLAALVKQLDRRPFL